MDLYLVIPNAFPSDRDTTMYWEISDEGDSLIRFIGIEYRKTAYIESISENQLVLVADATTNGGQIARLYYNR